MAKVYIKINNNSYIQDINSDVFLNSTNTYTLIDEGEGDKFVHAQGNYLDKPLYSDTFAYNYKFINGKIIETTTEEKEQQIKIDTPPSKPTEQELINAQLILEIAKLKAGIK